MNKLYVTNRKDWRKWLKENHKTSDGIWLIYYKKHAGKSRIPYDDAVEEALCFGWIDSIIKRIDDERFMQKFTPRNSKSGWSELNKKRVAKMIKQKRMTKAGLDKVNAAKANGQWNKIIEVKKDIDMPEELSQMLSVNKKAEEYYNSLSPSHKKRYVVWIASAKREETRIRRAEEAITLLKKKQKLGMK